MLEIRPTHIHLVRQKLDGKPSRRRTENFISEVQELIIVFTNLMVWTIMRNLQELSELGVPLYSEFGPHGGFHVLGEANLPSISFTDDEAAAIFFAVYALRHNIDFQYKTELFTALNKFYNMMPEDVRNLCRKMSQEAEHSANGKNNY